eukprot:CAMPEP_0176469398 /NCGR_PEP_ID=MMETSP0127-20121128/39769_1 /TAXON_ID=938130 /ORGANISM="Platyophrya macrostoma, Strain WH" /LENGTH=54 /DNA_ID=CAMNT_0017863359 /DNA_START=1 /DNA_END=165 /DNA_ORIENTATION=-
MQTMKSDIAQTKSDIAQTKSDIADTKATILSKLDSIDQLLKNLQPPQQAEPNNK